jgi:hypothetical protein
LVHQLVLYAFSDIDRPEKSVCNHIDGNKINNNSENLEWISSKENALHSYRTGLQSKKGIDYPETKLTVEQVVKIKTVYKNCQVEKGYWKKVANELKVKPSCITNILKNRTWKRIIV